MNLLTSLFLGTVQGLTEFLPVSSSGHLVLFQKLIPSFSQPGVLFDVVVHLGTTFAVIIYFRDFILKFKAKYLKLIIVGSIPAAAFGILFRRPLVESFSVAGFLLGLQFLITSVFCFLTDRTKVKRDSMGFRDSLFIGVGQALAILPAISRSGATIFAGSFLGIDKRNVARFSFLLSVPAILGANLVEFISFYNEPGSLSILYYISAFFSALFVGLVSIKVTMKLLENKKFSVFGVYTFILAVLAILLTK